MPSCDRKKFNRVIDANFNRAKEGLRVCEDICRFILDAKALTRQYKDVRHQLTESMKILEIPEVILSRDIAKDVGRPSTVVEFQREGVTDIFCANSQRVKESIRVLEEFAKFFNKKLAEELKEIRYQIYALEKRIIKRC